MLVEYTEQNMSSSTELIIEQLNKLHLGGLCEIVQRTNSFIAGSYAIPFVELTGGINIPDDRDIDIWIPKDVNQTKTVVDLVQYLIHQGYRWPSSYGTRNQTEGAYRRMERSIHRIYTLCHNKVGLPKTQLIALTKEAGHAPEDIVRNFDLTLLYRWFDGDELVVLPAAIDALTTRKLEISLSQDIKSQTMSEWVRTAERLCKYVKRGFQIKWQVDPFDTILLNAAVSSIYTHGVLNVHKLEQWNRCIRKLDDRIPYLVVTVCPPAHSIAQIHVVRTMNNRLFLNENPRVHWDELTTLEQMNAKPIAVSSNSRNDRSVSVRRMYDTIEKEKVATLLEFPLFEVRSRPRNWVETKVHNVAMVEQYDETVYLDMNPKNNIIIIDQGNRSFGLMRSQLLKTTTYVACLHDRKTKGIIAQVSLRDNVYVPLDQLIAAIRSPFVYFGVRPMNIRFEHTVDRKMVIINHQHMNERMEQIWNLYAIQTAQNCLIGKI
jgi:hypothetical protein